MKNILQYTKKKIMFFVIMLGIFCILFASKKQGTDKTKAAPVVSKATSDLIHAPTGSGYDNSNAHENAYLACLYDDVTNSFRCVVIHSGMEIEYNRVSAFFPYDSMALYGNASSGRYRLPIYNTVYYTGQLGTNGNPDQENEEQWDAHCIYFNDSGAHWMFGEHGLGVEGTGTYDWSFANNLSSEYYPISDYSKHYNEKFDTNVFGEMYAYSASKYVSNTSVRPLTFPGVSNRDASSADINRAYAVLDAIGSDFMDALIYLNDGYAYKDYSSLYSMSYALVTAQSGVNITNQYGSIYKVNYHAQPDDSGYLWQVDITCVDNNSSSTQAFESRTRTFNYKVKKGYRNCHSGEIMENGTPNNLNMAGCESDTEFVSWEHLFVEAMLLNEQGVTYANQTDLFSVSSFEDSVLRTTRNLLMGLRSILDVFGMDELIFNLGQRSTSIYVFGMYKSTWNTSLSILFLIMAAIALSLYTISLVKLLIERQVASFSPYARVSLINGVKNILISLAFTAFAWVFFRLILMINFRFVAIFQNMISGKTFLDAVGIYTTSAGILFQYVMLIITIYVNFIYILRGIIVPMLFCASPLFIYALSLGPKGAMVTKAWLKELLGNVFIQSVHAFVYGFIIFSSTGMRGIESVILCSTVIPLTSITKNIFGMGGDTLLKAGSSLTSATSNLASAKIGMDTAEKAAKAQATGNILGSVVGGIGTVAGAAFGGPAGAMAGSALGNGLGGLARGGGQLKAAKIQKEGGMKQLGLGAGTSLAMMGEDNGAGTHIAAEGSRNVQQSSYMQAAAYEQMADSLIGATSGMAGSALGNGATRGGTASGGGNSIPPKNQRLSTMDTYASGAYNSGAYYKTHDGHMFTKTADNKSYVTDNSYTSRLGAITAGGSPHTKMTQRVDTDGNKYLATSAVYKAGTSDHARMSNMLASYPGGVKKYETDYGVKVNSSSDAMNISFNSSLHQVGNGNPQA